MADAKSTPTASSFLQRWALRKQEARRQTKETDDPAAVDAPAVMPGVIGPESPVPENLTSEHSGSQKTEENPQPISAQAVNSEKPFEQLDDNDMPALDSLDEKSDYRAFFAPKVSAELRRLALRKLFHSPKFNIRDGLDDFDDDYTYFEPLGDTVTADMKHMQAVAQKRAELQEQAEKTLLSEQVEPDSTEPAAAREIPAANAGVETDSDTDNEQIAVVAPGSAQSDGQVTGQNVSDSVIPGQIAAPEQAVTHKQTDS